MYCFKIRSHPLLLKQFNYIGCVMVSVLTSGVVDRGLSPGWVKSKIITIQRGFAPGFVNYKKRCTRLAAASDKVYQLLAHGWRLSLGTPSSYTTKTGRHDIAEILLKEALNTKNKNQSSSYELVIVV
jgi:hypothetical protein